MSNLCNNFHYSLHYLENAFGNKIISRGFWLPSLPYLKRYTLRLESRFALTKAVRLLEVMSTSVFTGLNPFNFIHKHFLQICL